jgi:hypothetical protein
MGTAFMRADELQRRAYALIDEARHCNDQVRAAECLREARRLMLEAMALVNPELAGKKKKSGSMLN